MNVTLYQMKAWDKWASRSAEKKIRDAQQKAIRPFLKSVQHRLFESNCEKMKETV